MTVYIGIVSFNSLADLPACINAIRAQTYPDRQIVIRDNASTDGSPEWLAQNVPEALLIRGSDNVGFGVGHNILIRTIKPVSDGDFYLTCNPDLVMGPNYVAALVEAIQESGAGWVVGKLYLPHSEGDPPRLYSVGHALRRDGYAFNVGMGLIDQGQFERPREVFGAPGCAALYSGRLIKTLAPTGDLFDPDFFLYGEDTDLDWRARLQGWRCIYVPGAMATHRGSSPKEELRAMALAHRYLSVIKNAYPFDLITFNLPFMGLHLMVRCFLTPRLGTRLAGQIVRLTPRFWGKRTRPILLRGQMQVWFRWARQQSTAQPRTVIQRWAAFVGSRGSVDNHPNDPPKPPPPPYGV